MKDQITYCESKGNAQACPRARRRAKVYKLFELACLNKGETGRVSFSIKIYIKVKF